LADFEDQLSSELKEWIICGYIGVSVWVNSEILDLFPMLTKLVFCDDVFTLSVIDLFNFLNI
jgi:hypothetical protein